MKICFFNTNHIGDIYFSSFFIRRICQLNPEIDFYYYCIQGDIFFQGVSNIQRINRLQKNYNSELINGEPPEQLLDNSTLSFILNTIGSWTKYKVEKYNGEEILFINTWCAVNQCTDFELIAGNNCWSNIVERTNREFGFTLQYECSVYRDLIYKFEIEFCHKEYSDIDYDNTIFIFNYKPRSLEFDYNKLQNYILSLSESKKVIVSCYDSILDGNSNIRFIDRDFGFYPTPCCSNLVYLWRIAKKCHKVVILPTGSSWIFFHELTDLLKGQLYMFDCPNYCNSLNSMISLIDPSLNDFIQRNIGFYTSEDLYQ